MPLPLITIQLNNAMYGLPSKGSLVYQYNPFYNLQNPNPINSDTALTGLQLNSKLAGINITEPVSLETEVAYDGSVNLIVNDYINPLKLINSRFYQTSTTTYEIADRKGNLDTNIYKESTFNIETNLIKNVRSISTVDFLGIKDGGIMKVGNYTFYFKLADADGNETDFIAESGKVICHIGAVNSPKSIRGGLLDELSYKLIKFRLKNLDLAYDYINIYYTRSTGDGDQEIVKTYKITDKFKITNNNVDISITGYENHEEISKDEINIQYSMFDSVKTAANCQNITFAGNVTNDFDLFKTLEKYSLHITPEVAYDKQGIGYLDASYRDLTPDIGYEYYNTKNIYYKLGYWDEEIYRFGIVYILNNYTLSPVFNIRGKKILDVDNLFKEYRLTEAINAGEDYIIEGSDPNNPENIKGVFKIDASVKSLFNGTNSIKPLGLRFNFNNSVVEGINEFTPGLKDLTKGFFIVRQKRLPTILAQSVGIATSKLTKTPTIQVIKPSVFTYKYIAESFLTMDDINAKLQPSFFDIPEEKIENNALLCPEANVRRTIFNTIFNSSEFTLKNFKYNTTSKVFHSHENTNNFVFKGLLPISDVDQINSELTLIEPGTELMRNSKYEFSSKLGDAAVAYKFGDPLLGDYNDPANSGVLGTSWNETASKVRGIFNTYIGCSSNNIVHGKYYNIFSKDYNMNYWKDYFLIRYNDASPFFPISDRIEWKKLAIKSISPLYGTTNFSDIFYRGDCYINTFTQRMHWNFIDPELPTNKYIIDPFTWAKNCKILKKVSTIVLDTGDLYNQSLEYNKLLLLYTYKNVFEPEWAGDTTGVGGEDPTWKGILEPTDKKFKKYSERNGLFGAEKINRPDVNAVPLGHWVTFKICSNVNLALRDLDFSQPMEEALHKIKRGFYPLQSMDAKNSLPESDVLNNGLSKTLGDKYYFEIPDVPFIKTNFSTRIHYSNLLQNSTFINGNRIFESKNYLDYTNEYGSLVKLIEWYGSLIAVMEHGILMIPVNERAMMTNASGENVYINTETILPQNPKVLSNTFGSLWADSITKTSRYIYGIDTVAKKIWRTDGETFQNIGDLKIQRFLNDNINLRESDKDNTININFVKTHYNAFKYDLLFTFKYGNKKWHLCWNELLNKWITQYTWFPEFSENINNIFYTFANQSSHSQASNKLYKHGFAGTFEESGNIQPTYWYNEQHPFEYEFIIAAVPGTQKIFENLVIISNAAEPDSFFYEWVGDGFNWSNFKSLIIKLNNTTLKNVDGVDMTDLGLEHTETNVKARYKQYLIANPALKKLPFIFTQSTDINMLENFFAERSEIIEPFKTSRLKDINLSENVKTKEITISNYQKGANIKQYGRLKGNMHYVEDSWNIQMQSLSFPYAYLSGQTLILTKPVEMKIRDNYLKLRVKYTGKQYAIINALRTLFTISYA